MMHVGCGSDGCLETGSGSCERRTNATVADERGLHTRPGDLSFSACGYPDASLKPRETLRMHPPLTGHTRLQRAGFRYEYRSLKRFAQEARLRRKRDLHYALPTPSRARTTPITRRLCSMIRSTDP